jgi:hypothetical protein
MALTQIAAGRAAVLGLISAEVAALTEAVMKTMLMNKLKGVTAILLAMATIVLACGVVVGHRQLAPPGNAKTQTKPAFASQRDDENLKAPVRIENAEWARAPIVGGDWEKLAEIIHAPHFAIDQGRLFCVTRDRGLWVRDSVASEWRRLGATEEVAHFTASGGKLFCIQHNGALWEREPVAGDDWRRLGEAENVAHFTASGGKLFCIQHNGALWERESVAGSAWRSSLGRAENVACFTGSVRKLYRIQRDGALWERDLMGGGDWQSLGIASFAAQAEWVEEFLSGKAPQLMPGRARCVLGVHCSIDVDMGSGRIMGWRFRVVPFDPSEIKYRVNKQGQVEPMPGYVWKPEKGDYQVEWDRGSPHPTEPHVIAGEKEGHWVPAAGYTRTE